MSSFAAPPLPCHGRHRAPLRASRGRRGRRYHHPVRAAAARPMPANPHKQRLRARVSYDGTNYRGWQYQPHHATVQGALEAALRRKFGQTIRVVGASRTDTGVHARGQAMHFDIPAGSAVHAEHDLRRLHYTLNQMLPPDVRLPVLDVPPPLVPCRVPGVGARVDVVERPWHAIYNASGKLYTYRISTGEVFDPTGRLYRYHEWRAHKFGFSEELLRAAASRFEGAHDFSAFTNSTSPPPGYVPPVLVNPIRNVRSATVVPEGDGLYRIEFVLDGAMYKMIRNIVGTILSVSCGKMELSNIDSLFESKDRRKVPKSAPARGLCLEKVFYEEWDL